jgi:CHAT domain-containing protein
LQLAWIEVENVLPSVVLSFLVTAALVAQSPVQAGEAFVHALVADQPAAVRSLAAGSDSDLTFAIDVVEKYDCITIRHYDFTTVRATESTAKMWVAIDGTGVTNGAIRREWALQARWWLELVATSDGWGITYAAPETKVFADELIAALESERACTVAARPDLDLAALTQQIAYGTASPAYAATDRGAMAFAAALAASLDNPATDLYVVRMDALLAAFRGETERAASLAGDAIIRARRLGDVNEIASGEFQMGIVSWFAGNTDEAVHHLEESAKLTGAVADPRSTIRGLYMSGLISGDAGRLRQSLSAIEGVQALSTVWGWEEGKAVAALQRGNLHSRLGDATGARSYYWEAYALARRANNTIIASYALHNAAARRADVTDEDIVVLERAIALTPGGALLTAMQATLVEMLAALGRTEEAEAVLRKAEAVSSLYADPWKASRVALRLRQGRYAEALEEARKPDPPDALPGIVGNDVREMSGKLDSFAGKALRHLGRDGEAAIAFETAISLIEERRAELAGDMDSRSMFLEGNVEPYHELMDIDLARGRVQDALLLGEKLRARTLREVLEQGRVDISPSMTEEEKSEEARLTKDVADLNRRVLAGEQSGQSPELRAPLAEARSALSRFQTELYVRHPDLLPRRGDAMPAAEHLAGLLPGEEAAALVYSVHGEHTHVFVLRRAGSEVSVDVRTLNAGRKDLETRISHFVEALERRDLGFGAEARSLFELLVAPVERELRGARIVCVVPDGPLWHLPFQVLRTGSGEYLVERAAIFFAPSLSVLRLPGPRRTASGTPRLLAFGNPTFHAVRPALYRGGALDSLPDAEREVRSIGALYGPSSRVLLRGDARESAAKELAGAYDILHFATHAVVDDAAPLYSSLVMAGSTGEDGLLEGREILDLPLHADLAVLSACETARGSVRSGEGLIGMSWALMAAGCPTTVVSEWKVASASTAELMIEFHRQLRQPSKVSKAEALRRAQLHLLRGRYRHPFYWSAFVLIGNGW